MSDEMEQVELTDDEKAFLAGVGEDEQAGQVQPESPPAEGVDSPAESAQPQQGEDILASLPDEIRDRFAALEKRSADLEADLAKAKNEREAAVGKVAPLQRKLAEFERQSQRTTQAQLAAPVAPAPPQTAEELDALIETEEFKQWALMFPEEAKQLKGVSLSTIKAAEKIAERIAEKRVNDALQQIQARYEPLVETVTRDQADRDLQGRITQLERIHPDWRDYNSNEDFGQFFFNEYLAKLPAMLREQFNDDEKVREALRDPDFTSSLIGEYKAARGIGQQGQAIHSPPQQPQAKLKMATQPSIKPSAVNRPMRMESMTPDQAFLAGLNSD